MKKINIYYVLLFLSTVYSNLLQTFLTILYKINFFDENFQ